MEFHSTSVRRWFAVFLALPFAGFASGAEKKPKADPQAVTELKQALELIKAKQFDPAFEKLQGITVRFPKDPAAENAQKLLREYGVGKEVRIVLEDREFFRSKLKIPDESILDMEEKIFGELRAHYKPFPARYKTCSLRAILYDSQARFREKGGSVTSSGHYRVAKQNRRAGILDGKIEWYFPREASIPKDRQLFMKSLLYHETAHHLNQIHFDGAIPSILDEGLATHFTSRLNTETYQHYRQTDRQRFEREARNAVNSIQKYDDFARMLDGGRGFGQGDIMVDRWYGLCYSIVDFFAEGELESKKLGLDGLLGLIEEATKPAAGPGEADAKPAAGRPPMKEFLAKLVEKSYGAKVEDFHRGLIKHILARYKQR